MKRLFSVAAIIGLLLTMASISWASANLNLSKSNINRVQYSNDTAMTSTQAAALVAEFDKNPPVNEADVMKALQKLSIPTNFRLIRVIPGRPNTILLLTNPAHAAEAGIAINDPGMPAEKSAPIKSR
ncbi:hypothetical protein [Candidatus Methylomirabilis sp.]|jgi:hypothetical protein|uniref:hypothetical protein n=1 Tax=Candidatus Methylomirabilis sp. TaxID=2032687 RepID=UPI003C78658A